MKIGDLKTRIDQLISLSENVLSTSSATQNYFGGYDNFVEILPFNQFRSSSLSFLKNLFDEHHPYYKEFNDNVTDCTPVHTNVGKGILLAVKQEIDGGWLFTLKGLVSAEIFSDFLEMAEHLLEELYKDPAAVMTGSVLEEHLRQLCDREGIAVEVEKAGKLSPKKADLLNAELANAGVYNKLDQKIITSWLDLRNKAAHGRYTEYTKEQVDLMYQGVANFISRTS